MKDVAIEIFESFLDFLFPQFCIKCGIPGTIICDDCRKDFSEYGKQRCFVCSKFSKNGVTHKKCRSEYFPDQLIVVNEYGKLEKEIIHRLKYRNGKMFAQTIADLIMKKLKSFDFTDYIICPIPLHKKRLMIRGYNQVELVAKALSKDLQLETRGLLTRTKNTRPQHELNKKERKANLEEAFQVSFKSKIPQKIILLDDLTTSGSTFEEATKALKSSGARRIICLAFARGK